MSATIETIDLLKSIDARLKTIVELLRPREAPKAEDLDGPHGDPEVKAKDPRDWTGPSMTGRRFSQCPPTYLDLLADRYDYFASQEADAKKANYNRRDAARARGWAARIRAQGPNVAAEQSDDAQDVEIRSDEVDW